MGGILLRRLALGNNLHVIYNQLAARRALVTVAPEAGGEDYRQFVFIPGKIDRFVTLPDKGDIERYQLVARRRRAVRQHCHRDDVRMVVDGGPVQRLQRFIDFIEHGIDRARIAHAGPRIPVRTDVCARPGFIVVHSLKTLRLRRLSCALRSLLPLRL